MMPGLSEASEEEVSKIINSLFNKNSCSFDHISQKVLKIINAEITPTLTKLINSSISERVYPNALKLAKIIPLHKKGSVTDCNNYRPISLLSAFNKIFERKIHNYLVEYIERNNILFPTFRPQFSHLSNLAILIP